MLKSVVQYLEKNADTFPNKCIFSSQDESINYQSFVLSAKKVGSSLVEKSKVAIVIDKSVNCLIAMFGCAYANACYTIIDVHSPIERINTILHTFEPSSILTDKKCEAKVGQLGLKGSLVLEELFEQDVDEEKLAGIKKRMIDTDPLYVLFTSGSTGIPKGTVVCHRSVIDYAEVICKTFDIDENTVWGSQTPFYFSMSILDVYSTIVAGATLNIIPKVCFSFPAMLVDYLNENKINSIYWVPTALNIVADFDTFDECKPQYLKKVLFAGEVMPTKQLNYWIKHLPEPLYANLYGPTEITDTCTYYIVDRPFNNNESLPIGIPFDNCEVIVINEENQRVSTPEDGQGVLYVRGSFLGLGYYNNPEKTAEAFVQNPLNKSYPELLYRTGDIVCFNEYGELLYKGRKDHQIKHMGHRIELGEIETAAGGIDGMDRVCCIYDDAKKRIVMFYTGNAELEHVSDYMKTAVPPYMVPQDIKRLDSMPTNMNGKIDRIKLKESI